MDHQSETDLNFWVLDGLSRDEAAWSGPLPEGASHFAKSTITLTRSSIEADIHLEERGKTDR